MADLVVADLTLDNPNVWYELGVPRPARPRRHPVQPRASQPFDICHRPQSCATTCRTAFPTRPPLAADRAAPAEMAKHPGLARPQDQPGPRPPCPILRNPPGIACGWATPWNTGNSTRNGRPASRWWRATPAALRTSWSSPTRPRPRRSGSRPTSGGGSPAPHAPLPLRPWNSSDWLLEFAPDHRQAQCQAGFCLRRLGRFDEARAVAKRLVEVDPGRRQRLGSSWAASTRRNGLRLASGRQQPGPDAKRRRLRGSPPTGGHP